MLYKIRWRIEWAAQKNHPTSGSLPNQAPKGETLEILGSKKVWDSYENNGFFMIFSDFPRLSRGTLSIVMHFSGIKNVHVGSLMVFAFGKIDFVDTADQFLAISWDQKVS